MLSIAPTWPNQIWFPDLMDLDQDAPIQLPHLQTLLRQPGNPPKVRPEHSEEKPTLMVISHWELIC